MKLEKKQDLYHLEDFSFFYLRIFKLSLVHIEKKSPNTTIPKIFSKLLKNEKD